MDSVSLQTIEDPSSGGFFVQYAWTDTIGGSASDLGSGQSVTMMDNDAGSHTVTVVATCDGGATQTATAAVDVKPVKITSLTLDPTSVAQHGRVKYTAITDPANAEPAGITWEYKRVGNANWTTFGNTKTVDNICESLIGTFDIKATLNSGGVVTVATKQLTVTARPVASVEADYYDHYEPAGTPNLKKWAEGTLKVTHPKEGERTCQPMATITLDLTQAANILQSDFDEIVQYKFTHAGKLGAGAWTNQTLDSPLVSNGATPPTYSVSFVVSMSGTNTYEFELYAEQPGDPWGAQFNVGPAKNHGTLFIKLKGKLEWAIDANGKFTTMKVTGLGATQASNVGTPSPVVPTRQVDHP